MQRAEKRETLLSHLFRRVKQLAHVIVGLIGIVLLLTGKYWIKDQDLTDIFFNVGSDFLGIGILFFLIGQLSSLRENDEIKNNLRQIAHNISHLSSDSLASEDISLDDLKKD